MSFGSDFSGVEDVDALLSDVTSDSGKSFSQGIARRLLQPRGSLFYDPDYGLDVRNFLSDTIPLPVAEAAIAAECLKDPRCFKAFATITRSAVVNPTSPETWGLKVNVENELGKIYELVFTASPDKLTLLEAPIS